VSYKKQELISAFSDIFSGNLQDVEHEGVINYFCSDEDGVDQSKIENFASHISEEGNAAEIDKILEMEADRRKADTLLAQACSIQLNHVRRIDNDYENLIGSYMGSVMETYISMLKDLVNPDSEYAEVLGSN
jgi:hypothetical protein